MSKNEPLHWIITLLTATVINFFTLTTAAATGILMPYIEISNPRVVTLVPSIHGFLSSSIDPANLKFRRDGYLFLEYDVVSISSADRNPLTPPIYAPHKDEVQERASHLADAIERALTKLGQPPRSLGPLFELHPYVLLTLMEQLCSAQANISSRSTGLDQILRREAIIAGMSVRSIESLEGTLSSVAMLKNADLIPVIKQIASRIQDSTCADGVHRYLDKLNNLLLQGDLPGIEAATHIFHQEYYGSKVLNEAYLDRNRNNFIANRIANIIDNTDGEGPLIFVVGASHFFGNFGIVKTLCDKGLHLSLKRPNRTSEFLCEK